MAEQVAADLDQFTRIALVARALTTALEPSEIVDIVVRQGMAGLHAEGGVVAFLDSDDVLVPAVTVGYPTASIAAFAPLTIDLDLPLTVAARDKEAVWVPSRADAAARFPAVVASSATPSQAWAAIPLVCEGSVLGVLGVSFLAPREFSEPERLFISALADLSALALGPRRSDGNPAPGPQMLSLLDRVTNRVFASTLTLAGITNHPGVDADVADRLHDVIDDLDIATREIRSSAIAVILRDRDPLASTSRGATTVTETAGDSIPKPPVAQTGRRHLCRFDDGQVFAYARGHDFFRAGDDALWAHESDDLLLSARSGVPFARRAGRAFRDVATGFPLYYERAQ